MATTYVSDLNSLFNTIYERALFVAREMNLMAPLVDNRSATGWMNRVVPTRPEITAVTVADNADFSSSTTFGRSTTATLTPVEIIAQVVMTDRVRETDPDNAQMDAEMELGAAIATKIDVDLLSLFDNFAEQKGTAGSAATLSAFAAAINVLGYKKARQYGGINAVLHPYHWHDLWLELGKPTTNVVASDTANQALRDYFVQDMLGAKWYTSANIGTVASDDAYSAVFTKPAIMLDTRRATRLEAERDASARAWELNVTAGYAFGVVRDDFGAGLIFDATEPT